MEEDTAPGLPGPAFSSRPATQSTRAPGSGGYHLGATPATFEFQPPPPFSPPSARKDQSSPSPQPRANRRALRLPGPHPARPAPSPSCFARVWEAGWLVTLPAPLPPLSPTPLAAVVALHFRSAPSGCALRQKMPGTRRTDVAGVGVGVLEVGNHACASGDLFRGTDATGPT